MSMTLQKILMLPCAWVKGMWLKKPAPCRILILRRFKQKRDPDHLPPANKWEHAGNQLRKIAHFFASPEAHFAFRVATATMCIAVINELRETQTTFTTRRFFWAQVSCGRMLPVPETDDSL